VWTGRDLPFTLQDKGYHFLDQNGIRMSQYLMLLLFAAADAIHDKEAPVDGQLWSHHEPQRPTQGFALSLPPPYG
jgi:hypothetical protein